MYEVMLWHMCSAHGSGCSYKHVRNAVHCALCMQGTFWSYTRACRGCCEPWSRMVPCARGLDIALYGISVWPGHRPVWHLCFLACFFLFSQSPCSLEFFSHTTEGLVHMKSFSKKQPILWPGRCVDLSLTLMQHAAHKSHCT